MKKITQTMRWYGPNDIASLKDLKQCGISGIVTALHQIPVGDVWSVEAIQERINIIEEAGLKWEVVESLPVHEDIKKGAETTDGLIDNYIESMKNLAQCGVNVITYNFMPILDWVRTHHKYVNPDTSESLYFHKDAFVFAKAYGETLNEEEKKQLFKNVLLGLPGSTIDFTADQILHLLEEFKHIDEDALRKNLVYFLSKVAPVAEELGLKLAIHPDDPPYSVLGLPRIVSTQEDLEFLLNAVPVNANGLCYCTGSLGARAENNLLDILDKASDRIHFLHLRNVSKDTYGNFKESEHLNGDNPMEAIMEKIILLMNRRKVSLPMRPDHGFLHSIENTKKYYVGYSLVGRLKGLAELRGLELGISYKLKNT